MGYCSDSIAVSRDMGPLRGGGASLKLERAHLAAWKKKVGEPQKWSKIRAPVRVPPAEALYESGAWRGAPDGIATL